MKPTESDSFIPIVSGLALIGAGAALNYWRPRLFDLPDLSPKRIAKTRTERAALKGRDKLADFAPDNLTDTLGRSLAITGTALMLVGLFDAFLEARDEAR